MDITAPVSTIMTSDLITVQPESPLKEVQEIFERNSIHHLPVVDKKKILGIISKSDFLHFMHGFNINYSESDRFIMENRLKRWKAQEIMTTNLVTVSSTHTIYEVLKIFRENLFHALPVVDHQRLEGIVTTHDIIKGLTENEPKLLPR